MSQEKVDRHKEQKRNVKKIVKKEKREWMLTKAAMALVAVLLVAWIGVSVYHYSDISDSTTVELPTYTVDTTALDDYLTELYAEE
ncbi:MAG: hypothetical protein LUD16_04630 [Lachnospiraceae bacterium]|nr:hypothetical protein [Lachnospiraceae bacterium]